MDGTLIDSSELLANTINYVRKKIALPALPQQVILEAINDTSLNPARFFYNSDSFEKHHESYFHEYYHRHHHTQSRLYDGIEVLLEKLSQTHRLSVATNAYDVSAEPLLKALGIADYFDYIVCGNQVPKAKPHPLMIERIIDAYATDKKHFLMIGDGERDILAAQNAGIDGLLVQWGFSDHPEAVRSVDELKKRLGVVL
jgi:phosphoglycolate phosphatase